MELLPQRLLAQPDATRTALAEPGRTISYAALLALAQGFAGGLRARGLRSGDRVAVALPNGIEAVAAVYGAWLAGAIAVPLAPQARAAEYLGWLRHVEPSFVVHAAGGLEIGAALAALEHPSRAIAVGGDDHDAWDRCIEVAPPSAPSLDPEAPAQILLTSGTTGLPKGVLLTHANLAANVDAVRTYLGLGADDAVVCVLPFHYSYGASVLHTHLAVGARVCIEPNGAFPQVVVDRLAAERATGFPGVPSTFALLLERLPPGALDLPHLRYLTQAGGPMPAATIARLRAAAPRARLFVMYGQTEATARLTYLPPERLADKTGSVGIPVAGVRIEVRREDGAPAAIGETGEIWASGPNVMRGYWRDPVASAKVLRDGWLCTGDNGHLDADGMLWLAGRRADMIKSGAHRIHPQDIEEAIAELPGVAEVAVVGVPDPLLGEVVRACIVRTAALEERTVRAHCRDRLSPHKLPREVVFVDALPRTASGKIKRADLRSAAHGEP